jgi:hypothetical protein
MDTLVENSKPSALDKIKAFAKKKWEEEKYKQSDEYLLKKAKELELQAAKIKNREALKKQIYENKKYVSSHTGVSGFINSTFKEPDYLAKGNEAKKKLKALKAVNRYNNYKRKMSAMQNTNAGLGSLLSAPQQSHDYGFNSIVPKQNKKKSSNIFDF